MSDYEFITISWAGSSVSGKTQRYAVRSTRGAELGEIKWFGRWRQYVFFPASETVYSRGCLNDISGFIESLRSGGCAQPRGERRMTVPRFLPWWLGGEAGRVDGGMQIPKPDSLPDRPDPIIDPLPEDLERLLRDPEIAIERDWDVHRLLRDYLRREPDGRITREMYLNLWALIDRGSDA